MTEKSESPIKDTSSLMDKTYPSTKVENSKNVSTSKLNSESNNLTIMFGLAKKERLNYEQKYKTKNNKFELLKKEYEEEINKISEIRSQSLKLYNLKKGINEWKKERDEYRMKVNQKDNKHKLNSLKNKLYHDEVLKQIKNEILNEKQKDVKNLKIQTKNLEKIIQTNKEEEYLKKKNYYNKVKKIHQIQQIKKQIYNENKITEMKNLYAEKTNEEKEKKIYKIKKIKKIELNEVQMLKKLQNIHYIHKMALEEFNEIQTKPINLYEEKYKKPIKIN